MPDDPFATQPSNDPVSSSDTVGAVPLPKQIGRFRIERILGQGGFGVVYLGFDDQLQRKVAIKVPKPQFVQRAEDRELYLKEARTVASLEHPSIVPVLEVGSTPEFPVYIVSKFIVGRDLAVQLETTPPTYHQSVQWMIDLADALREAHRKGFVHRDVKPQNVLVDPDNRVFLVDFGLALADRDVGKRLPAGGTPTYMSPEQARGEGHRVDGRSDLFSLGILFYEMLCGRRPFQGNTQLELFEQITDLDPKPLRQWVDSVPQELERICFKMLAKRKSERYSSAKDLADDLRVFLTKSQLDSQSAASIRPSDKSPTSSNITKGANSDTTPIAATPSSGSRTLKIVPKGLRSFDHRDADFFLELLPGARDRDGLPESVGFWKSRIEEMDADQTFEVGLVYGPSGCGKSSMMKAGLLPRLAPNIVSIYLEATVDDTERTLLGLIRKKLDNKEADSTASLVDLLYEVRLGRKLPRGEKLVIVIDQFEQWLFAHPTAKGQLLLEALLQCDGSRVQAIVMVRDDFWMAATRFFRDLDISLECRNSAAVDLFDIDHAERVLKAFGRAFGKLESDGKEDKQDRKQFIKDAVHGLSENGKTISVRLSLFAEMMKARPWTPESLRKVGGTTGVGATFLEETFSAPGAPPHHRVHQEAARSVLRAMLPQAGTDIKGHKRSTEELRAACGYGNRQRDFDDLIRILDGELRLITPVDSTEPEALAEYTTEIPLTIRQLTTASQDQLSPVTMTTQYQLTHDYLVPALRDWLTRKQRETSKGRAELNLAERASNWTIKRESMHLPTITEWIRILWLTNHNQWTETQRNKMIKTRKTHLFFSGLRMVVILLVSIALFVGWAAIQFAQLKSEVFVKFEALKGDYFRIYVPQKSLSDIFGFGEQSAWEHELQTRYDNESQKATLALLLFEINSSKARLNDLITQIDRYKRDQIPEFIRCLRQHKNEAINQLRTEALRSTATTLWRRRAKIASAALCLEVSDIAEDMCVIDGRPNPEQRTLFISEFENYHDAFLNENVEYQKRIDNLTQKLARYKTPLSSGVLLSNWIGSELHNFNENRNGLDCQELLLSYHNNSDALAHSSLSWYFQKLLIPIRETSDSRKIVENRLWFLNSSEMTFIKITPVSFHQETETNKNIRGGNESIMKEFWIADREVSVGKFREFTDDNGYPAFNKPVNREGIDVTASPAHFGPTGREIDWSDNMAVQQVNWYDAIMYCNWLSNREGYVSCYEKIAEKETGNSENAAWRLVPGATGYRLPSESEWEFACRAGTTTDFSCGNDQTLLVDYAHFSSNRSSIFCGQKRPNGWGLFDMHGNVSEWCDDITNSTAVICGGSWKDVAEGCRSSNRHRIDPSSRSNGIGFRVVLGQSVQSSALEQNK